MSEKLITQGFGWNVIDEKTFKDRVRTVFSQVANALVNTMGPYGATTIIEKYGEMHVTKDGWSVAKKLQFDDPINNNILNLLINIGAQVVLRTGDGSTSSFKSADSILAQLESSDQLKKMRPKEFMTTLSSCVERIAMKILEISTKIDVTTDPDLEQIYKLAMISTNGDEKVSRIIQTIYKQTNNPSIEYVQSKTNETTYEVVEGYKLKNLTYLDGIYVTNDDGSCIVENPMIILFDHKIDKEIHFDKILQPLIQQALASNRRLVVVAPNYDRLFLQYLAKTIQVEYNARGTSTVVYTRSSLINNMSQEQYNDFAVMCGTMIMKESQVSEYLDSIEAPREGATTDEVKPSFDLNNHIGTVSKMTIGLDNTLIQGFVKRDETMYGIVLKDAQSKFNKIEQNHMERGVISSDLYEMKQRLSKLKGIMGIIRVGGNSSLEKASNFDLVEDAVKATESAFSYGYNLGGNLIIPIVIKEMVETLELNENEKCIMDLLSKAFRDVFFAVLANKYTQEAQDKPEELYAKIDECILKKKCFDLINDEYSDDIINPCLTDVEILKAATSIVSLLISSNQYVTIHKPGQIMEA